MHAYHDLELSLVLDVSAGGKAAWRGTGRTPRDLEGAVVQFFIIICIWEKGCAERMTVKKRIRP